MEVVHLAVGLPDMVAKVARATRAVEGTMRAVGLNARAAAAEKIISVSASVIVGRRRGGSHGTISFCQKNGSAVLVARLSRNAGRGVRSRLTAGRQRCCSGTRFNVNSFI